MYGLPPRRHILSSRRGLFNGLRPDIPSFVYYLPDALFFSAMGMNFREAQNPHQITSTTSNSSAISSISSEKYPSRVEVMDIWSCFQKRTLKFSPLNYALVGRWILGLPGGTFCHHTIVSAPPLRGGLLTGWVFHYLTGMIFAVVPLILYGENSSVTSLSAGLLSRGWRACSVCSRIWLTASGFISRHA